MTSEAARRNEMVKSQIEREAARTTMDREAFLASLAIRYDEIHVVDVDHPRYARVFELLNKTNQFNTDGKRWTVPELRPCGRAWCRAAGCGRSRSWA